MIGARESGLGAGYVSRSICDRGRHIEGQETTDEKEQLW